jgi:hypothetical protein
MEKIINATGSDAIELWIYRSGKIVKKYFNNRTWLFVSGDSYYLTMLEKSLDATNYIYRYTSMNDIYGLQNGIQIYLSPSKLRDMACRIEKSFGSRLKIYNADINGILRFMVSRGIEFYSLKKPYEEDIDLPTAIIEPAYECGMIKYVAINGCKYYTNVYEETDRAIKENIIIIYNNYRNEFSILLNEMKKHGYYIEQILQRKDF